MKNLVKVLVGENVEGFVKVSEVNEVEVSATAVVSDISNVSYSVLDTVNEVVVDSSLKDFAAQLLLEGVKESIRLSLIEANSFLTIMGSEDFEKEVEYFVTKTNIAPYLSSNEGNLVILQVRHDHIFFDENEGLVTKTSDGYAFENTSYNEDEVHTFSLKEMNIGKPVVKRLSVPLQEVLLLPSDSNALAIDKLTAARNDMLSRVSLTKQLLERKLVEVSKLLK